MKILYKLFIVFALAALSAHASKIVSHKIKSGETLFMIARTYHSSIEDVRKLNGLKGGEKLKVGKILKVPTNSYFSKRGLRTHTVRSGETLSSLAKKYHTKVALIKKLNKIEKSKGLRVGKTLNIPKDTYFASKKSTKKIVVAAEKKSKNRHTTKHIATKSYTVHKGDTLYAIAKKHKMTIAELARINKTDRKATLKPGAKLKVAKIAANKKKKIVVARENSSRKRIEQRSTTRYRAEQIKASKAYRITSLAKKKLGRRYVWGATGSNTFDCSGFTTYVYKKNGIRLPRRAIAQSRVGKRVPRSRLRPGDLVFFDTSRRRRGYVNHVGIYLGNGKFIHASSAKKKVVITSLSKPFYARRFKVARRFVSSS